MRGTTWLWTPLALIAFGVGWVDAVRADPTNLAGGVLIAHHPAGMVYSIDPPTDGWCQTYRDEFAITSAEQQVNRTDTTGAPVFWFVLSAWFEEKEFCGAEFGLGDYDDAAFDILEWGACGEGFSPLEIPNGAWPEPNSGISIAVPGEYAWRGNYIPIYYFVGYPYAPGTRVEITLDRRPPPLEPFAGWANCLWPSVAASATCLGAFGILQDGAYCAPPPPGEIPGACCFGGGECQFLLPEECETAGGSWNGAWTCVEPNPCETPWACCIHDEQTGHETCAMLMQFECEAAGGMWHTGQWCQYFVCPTIRACCIDQVCVLTTEAECLATYHGSWMPDAFSCTTPSNPCQGIPAQPETWGRIKNLYR